MTPSKVSIIEGIGETVSAQLATDFQNYGVISK